MIFRKTGDRKKLYAQWLGGFTTQFFANVFLMFTQKLGVELDISRLVNTMDVSERGSDAKVRANGTQGRVDIPDILRLSVELGIIDSSVINTVLFTASDTDLHLEPDAKGSHALEILDAGGYIVLLALLGKVKHMRGEERFLVLLEISLIGLKHAVKPRQEFVSAMVRVQDDGTWWR